MGKAHYVLLFLLLLILPDCAGSINLADFDEFSRFREESPLTEKHKNVKPPVIFIPGIKGTFLTDDAGNEKWGKSHTGIFLNTYDEILLDLSKQFNPDDNSSLEKWIAYYNERKIKEDRILDFYQISLSQGIVLLEYHVYNRLPEELVRIAGYKKHEEDKGSGNLFVMPYDWRLDNRVAAVKLGLLIDEWSREYENYLKNIFCNKDNVCYQKVYADLEKRDYVTKSKRFKFNIVAHSMGGLVARYFAQILDYDNVVKKLIVLGTPNKGSMDALKTIAEGDTPEGAIPMYDRERTRPVIFSLPSIYQLLPRYDFKFIPSELIPEQEIERKLALTSDDIQPDRKFEEAAEKWNEYSLIPCNNDDEISEGICNGYRNKKTVKKFLAENLRSSYKFFQAINDSENIDLQYECKRLRAAETFLKDTNRHWKNEKVNFLPYINEKVCNDTVKAVTKDFKLIILGGFKEKTLSTANIKKAERKNSVYELSFDGRCTGCSSELYSLGDGTVAIKSIKYRENYIADNANFYLSESHVKLVRNKTFLYNVMRVLLDLE